MFTILVFYLLYFAFIYFSFFSYLDKGVLHRGLGETNPRVQQTMSKIRTWPHSSSILLLVVCFKYWQFSFNLVLPHSISFPLCFIGIEFIGILKWENAVPKCQGPSALSCFTHQGGWYELSCEVTQSCPSVCNPMDCNYQAPPSMEFSRQEYWSGLPFPSPGEAFWPRDRTRVSHTAGRCFTIWATREAHERSCLVSNR